MTCSGYALLRSQPCGDLSECWHPVLPRRPHAHCIHASTPDGFEFADSRVPASFLSVFVLRALNLESRSMLSDIIHTSAVRRMLYRHPSTRGALQGPCCCGNIGAQMRRQNCLFATDRFSGRSRKRGLQTHCIGPAPAGGNPPETVYLSMQPLLTKLIKGGSKCYRRQASKIVQR